MAEQTDQTAHSPDLSESVDLSDSGPGIPGPESDTPVASAEQTDLSGAEPRKDPAGSDTSEEPDVGGAEQTAQPEQTAVDADATAMLAAERLLDLQRLQAEYVNYKRRVERDRALAGDLAIGRVIESLLPVLDDIYLAQQHGDLEGSPFASIADKLDATLVKQGVERYGQPGEAFDPTRHEALMHTEAELAEGTSGTTVVQVLQPGYRLGERVLRPARVAVADPT